MENLKTITNEQFGLENSAEINLTQREAVRAVLLNDKDEVAIIFVENGNYHKIPGGGIEEGETQNDALCREVMEEAGADIEVLSDIGVIQEKRDGFEQNSYCYLARVKGDIKKPEYTDSEIKKGFQDPEWLSIDDAIEAFKSDKATFIQAQFMSLRDRSFLEAAKDLLNK